VTFQTAVLTGTYQKLDGTPASGLYEIIPNSPIVDVNGNVIRSGYQKGSLDSNGHFSVTLPATDDASLEPATNRQYTIIVKPNHSRSSAPILEGITLLHGQTYDTADLTTGVVAVATYGAFFNEQDLADLHAADTTNASAITAEADLRSDADDALDARLDPVESALTGRLSSSSLNAAYVARPAGGSDGQVLTKSGANVLWGAGSISVVDNGDGTLTLTGSSVVNNGDGTLTLS
jgi:hypothetical protein